jgi:hypothetical protein
VVSHVLSVVLKFGFGIFLTRLVCLKTEKLEISGPSKEPSPTIRSSIKHFYMSNEPKNSKEFQKQEFQKFAESSDMQDILKPYL